MREPAVVGQHGAGPFRSRVVAQHHVVTLGEDLASPVSGFTFWSLTSTCRPACSIDPTTVLPTQAFVNQRSRLSQAVADHIGESGLVEESPRRSESSLILRCRRISVSRRGIGVEFLPDEPGIGESRRVSLHPGKARGSLHRRNHAVLVDLLDDQRHGAHDGRLDLLHRLHRGCSVWAVFEYDQTQPPTYSG